MKTKQNQNWKIPYTFLDRRTLCCSSCKNRILKVKLWLVGARERKKKAFFVPFILSEGSFFNICVLSQCIVYWIRFQNIHTFIYQKTLFHTLFCLFLRSWKAFSVSLSTRSPTQVTLKFSMNIPDAFLISESFHSPWYLCRSMLWSTLNWYLPIFKKQLLLHWSFYRPTSYLFHQSIW